MNKFLATAVLAALFLVACDDKEELTKEEWMPKHAPMAQLGESKGPPSVEEAELGTTIHRVECRREPWDKQAPVSCMDAQRRHYRQYESFEAMLAADEAIEQAHTKRLKQAADFAIALMRNADKTVEGLKDKVQWPADGDIRRYWWFTSYEHLFGAPNASGELELLREYFSKSGRISRFTKYALELAANAEISARTREVIDAGKPVFEKPLASPPAGLVDWYTEYHRTYGSDYKAPDFWVKAYGADTFNRDAVWWYMFLVRRHQENNGQTVKEWQTLLQQVQVTVAKRPAITVGEGNTPAE